MQTLPPIARLLAAITLAIGGVAILLFGLPREFRFFSSEFTFQKRSSLSPKDPAFPILSSYFPIQKIDRYAAQIQGGGSFAVDIAEYKKNGLTRKAQVFLENEAGSAGLPYPADSGRSLAWREATQFIQQIPDKEAVFLSWWDNAQRIELFTGANSWVAAPSAAAFESAQEAFWNEVSGGFVNPNTALRDLAAWYLSDADSALQSVIEQFGETGHLYFLLSLDDLARLSEMKSLSGLSIPFETRVFAPEPDIHRLISGVKRWAREKGNGSYLLQPLGHLGVRVWRITNSAGEKTLLARLLPFTSSLANPLAKLELIHRSNPSALISIYRWNTPTSRSKSAPSIPTR